MLDTIIDGAVKAPAAHPSRTWPILGAIVVIYLALGTIMGFLQGLGPVLRGQGIPLRDMRGLFLVLIPFGLAFLWAPWVDRLRWPWLRHRSGWILSMQALALLAVVAMAGMPMPTTSWWPTLILACIATAAVATTDLAVDAFCVEHVSPAHRARAAAAKMGGISIGVFVGGGVIVGEYARLQWQGSLLCIAAILALACVPVRSLSTRERGGRTAAQRANAAAASSLRSALRHQVLRQRLLRVTLVTCSLLALFSFNRLLLTDMGVPLARIAWLLGAITPLANAIACLFTPWLCRCWPARVVAWWAAGVGICATLLLAAAYWSQQHDLAIAAAIASSAAAAALYVVLASLILGWADQRRAATDYALLYGLGRLFATITLLLLPAWIAHIGWIRFLLVDATAFLLALTLLLRLPQAEAGPT
ncbi:MFS transporter [Rugamonas rivuli]|uniref:MFS transporter n=1 Tax=Rugamonas rivuli TaxID=2743358 RepID=A0A843SBV5_9BURK|nr:MFS transporter [Rugamonas rivuli]MQA18056.1 MFS transporter [Rugamonas rivuli]